MSQKLRRGIIWTLSILVVFCIWEINARLPGFPEIYFFDEAAIKAITATPTPKPTANPHWESMNERMDISTADYAMCRKVASGVSFSENILEAYLPDAIRIKLSIKYRR